jgi:hypothetical protein
MNILDNFVNELNHLSLSTISTLNQLDYEKLKTKLELMKKELDEKINSLNIGNATTRKLLQCTLDSQHFEWGMKDIQSLETNTAWLNYWVSNLKLCQDTANILSGYLLRYCRSLIDLNSSSNSYTNISTTLNLFNVTYLNLGIVIDDYLRILKKIQDNSGRNFQIPYIEDQEDQVSERITSLNNEIEKILLHNPEQSILGMSAIRIFLESYIMIITRDRIRSHLRKKRNNNNIDVKFSDDFYKKEDIFYIIQTLFPELSSLRVGKVLDRIYGLSSKSIHKGVPAPNYLIWMCWDFVAKELKSKFENLNEHSSLELEQLISNLLQKKQIKIIEEFSLPS